METVIVKPDVEMDSNMNIVTDTVSNVYIYKQVSQGPPVPQMVKTRSPQNITCREKRRRLPSGRDPWRQVPGLEYDLELIDLDNFETSGEDLEVEDEVNVKRARSEFYEMDSFVCENGYLSEDENCITPDSKSKDRRDKIIKLNSQSEKRQKKVELKVLKEPLVEGIIYSTGSRTSTVFKQWKGIPFSSTPIPTGIYIEKMLLRQSLAELHLTKIGSDPQPVSDISNLCKGGVETILYPPAVLDAPSTTVFSEKTGATEFTSLDTLLPGAPSSAPITGSAPVPSSAPGTGSAPCSEKNLFSDEYSIKYSIKYKVKELVDFYLSSRTEDDLGPEQLLNLLKMDEDLGRGNPTLVWKYINKFYFQHVHRQ
ncbi:uncharacterized protein LOC111697229 isoform X2 [Eurytemora carolleeae]|uniref:uncharacterized protein LOC111697229 isoform X2 n=1 Tax=Eurytemora carolleeae TaxID=1294199 RepID=UPI000C75802F|nr:uncharacterized protein LOC111697229 isoform X2 [Eurytemora carolleeae]|eukprot:XP_023322912.1 uncharacterized protein LOC111697229 isoform X2 [Eurytemora affinis]